MLPIKEKIQKQIEAGRTKPVAIFVDIDDTWEVVMKDREKDVKYKTEYFRNKSHEAWRLAQEHFFPLIAVTGRDMEMVQADQRLYIEDPSMPGPFLPFDAVYGGVGTEGYLSITKDGRQEYVPDSGWTDRLRNGFDRSAVYPVCQQLVARAGTNLVFQPRDSEANVAFWQKQTQSPPPFNKEPQLYKVSFYYYGNKDGLAGITDLFRKSLDAAGLDKVKITVSFAKDREDGTSEYNIDLTPVSKVDAIEHVCTVNSCTALFAGDSGNDYDALIRYGFAIIDPKPELVGQMNDIIVEKTTHFIAIKNRLTGQNKLIFKDPSPLHSTKRQARGPEVLLDAMRAFLLIEDIKAVTRT